MFKRAIFGIAILAVGCGGSGSSGPAIPVIQIAMSSGEAWATGTVDDSGSVYGEEETAPIPGNWPSVNGAYWVNAAGSPKTIPQYASQVFSEEVNSVSANGELFAGVVQIAQSQPEAPFVYDASKGVFHTFRNPTIANRSGFQLTSVTNGGVVTGTDQDLDWTDYAFNYDITEDSYSETAAGSYAQGMELKPPNGTKNVAFDAYSADHSFAVGSNATQFVIWNVKEGTSEAVGLGQVTATAEQISNDGNTVLLSVPTQEGNFHYLHSAVWIRGRGVIDLLELAKKDGFGASWTGTDFDKLSPDGRYLFFEGDSPANLAAGEYIARLRQV